MSLLGNILWIITGGLWMAIGWCIIGFIAFITIIGIPWGRSCFVIAKLSLVPFGKDIINREELTHQEDIGTGGFGLIGNIIWFLAGGLWLAISHLMFALLNAITIILIPFALQHLKLAAIALAPVGKTVVDKHLAEAARKANAESQLNNMRS